jgi:Zn-dependent protease
MARYIRVNNLKQTATEDLRIARSWKVIFLWGLKLARKRMNFMSAIPVPLPFRDFVVNAEAVPADAREKLNPLLQECARLGFLPPLYHVIRTLGGESVTTSANCRHSKGETIVRLMHTRMGIVHPAKEKVTMTLVSRLSDGRSLMTSDQPAMFNSAPNLTVKRQIGGSLDNLFSLHEKWRQEFATNSAFMKIGDEVALGNLCDTIESEALEFQLRRGVYEEVNPDEAAEQTTKALQMRELAGTDATDAAVLEQIEKLQNKQGSWWAALLLAVLSLGFFIGVGGVRWEKSFVTILTAVVAFHELGHYVAMRMLKYRDVRMFFVPLLGAAVMGRHYNVKGWQKAIVSLAGPVPGILVGLGLAAVGVATHNHIIEKAALVTLLLNGINLIPIVPLDGGWTLHAILFSRHFVLETAFLGCAGIGMLAASSFGLGKFWMYLGIAVLVGLPASYRIARAAGRLKASGLAAVSADAQTIPPETALAILHEVKQTTTGMRSVKLLSSQTLSIFQKLNATPPGVLASIALLLVYLGAGAAAIVGTGIVMASRAGLFQTALEDIWPKPTLAVDPSAVRSAGLTNENQFDWLAPTTVATFTNAADAAGAFESAIGQLQPNERLTLFGETLFVTGSAKTEWSDWLNAHGAKTFIERPGSNAMSFVSLQCRAADKKSAVEIFDECNAAFRNASFGHWPPWTSVDGLPAERATAAERFRYTWQCLWRIDRLVEEDPEYKRLGARKFYLPGKKSREDFKRSLEKQEALRETINQRELGRLAESDDPRLDRELVQLFRAWQTVPSEGKTAAWKALQDAETHRLGSLPIENRLPSIPRAWQAASSGGVAKQNNDLKFNFVTFYRTDSGLPALASYLQKRGCTDFHYEVEGGTEEPDRPEDEDAQK